MIKVQIPIQCKHEHTSFQGGMHFRAGYVWDDNIEACKDDKANLSIKLLSPCSWYTCRRK